MFNCDLIVTWILGSALVDGVKDSPSLGDMIVLAALVAAASN